MSELDDLRAQLEAERSRAAEFEQKYKFLLGEAAPLGDGKTVGYLEFRALVLMKVGKSFGNEQGWRSAFLNGCNGKYNDGHMTRWRKNGVVPLEAVQAIDSLDLVNRPTGQVWTEEERAILINEYIVVENGKVKLACNRKISDVAADLTKRFSRLINDNSVKSKMNSHRLSLNATKVVTPDFTPKTDAAPAPVAEAVA